MRKVVREKVNRKRWVTTTLIVLKFKIVGYGIKTNCSFFPTLFLSCTQKKHLHFLSSS